MKEMLFIDTSAFIALNDSLDPFHGESLSWVKKMMSQTLGLCTSFEVVAETATILRKKIGIEKAKKFLFHMQKPGIQILEGNDEIEKDAWQIFLKTQKVENLSFFDCWKVATMHYYGVVKIFTFDKVFKNFNVIKVE